jgi:hypothetical protein
MVIVWPNRDRCNIVAPFPAVLIWLCCCFGSSHRTPAHPHFPHFTVFPELDQLRILVRGQRLSSGACMRQERRP